MDQLPVDSHCAILSHMASFIMAGAPAPVLAAAAAWATGFGFGFSLVPTVTFLVTGCVLTDCDTRVREASRPSTRTSLNFFVMEPAAPAWVTFSSPLSMPASSVVRVLNGTASVASAVLLTSTRETLITMLLTTGALPGWETRSLAPSLMPASARSWPTLAAVVVVLAALPSATRLTAFGVEMETNEPETASWASFGTDSSEALATPSSVTSSPTVGEVVLMVRSAPSRLTLTALARLTLMTDPSWTWESAAGVIRSADLSSRLAPLTTWPTVPPKVWTELTLPSTLRVTVLLLPTNATSPSTSATSTTSCVPTLTKLNLPSDVKNLTTIAHIFRTVRARGKVHTSTRRRQPGGSTARGAFCPRQVCALPHSQTRARIWFVRHDARPAGVKLSEGLPRPRLIVVHCNRSVIKHPTNYAYRISNLVDELSSHQSQDPYACTVFSAIREHSSESSHPVNSAIARTV